MRIQHNIAAMTSYRNFNNNTNALSKNLEKLSSGYRINRAGDDAAGLAISEKMRAQISGLDAAQKNVKDGISLVKTAEGAMQEIQDMMNRMKYLATQSANATYQDDVDRENLQKEVDALKTEINRIADSANFNGQKLLNGELDVKAGTTVTLDSAISNISSEKYAPKGASDAFTAEFVNSRPEAKTSQTNAEFTVNLDAIKIDGLENGDKISVTIGTATLTATVAMAAGFDLTKLATALAASGKTAGTAVAFTGGAAPANTNSDTATWDAKATANASAAATKSYVKLDGHWWEVDSNATSLTFKQVDYMGESGEVVNPNYGVSVGFTDNDSDGTLNVSNTANKQVQVTKQGTAIGSTDQARVNGYIDFAKLKDGDTITVGQKNYTIRLGEGVTAGAGEIDLTQIFKQESDQKDAAKQAQALAVLVEKMGGTNNADWTIGNGGVTDGVGKLTFQSLSTSSDDTNYIGGNPNNDKVDMRTEADILKQFSAMSAESGASTSFEVDATKIKAGDTFTVDGKTYEFTDGSVASDKKNVAIDLSSLGISGGLLKSQTGDVMNAIKTAISGETDKYNITLDQNKLTMTSEEDPDTPQFESRVAAAVELPTETTPGSSLTLQIGDTADEFNQLAVGISDMHTDALGIADLDISTLPNAQAAIQKITDAINSVSSTRGDLGAIQNRLEHTANNLSVMEENIQDAESTIRDTDMADEMTTYTKNNILIQAAQAMLAQANQQPQGVLQLLQ